MAKQLSDLTVQLSGAPYSFLWPDNAAFLNGTQPHPHLCYTSEDWRREWLQVFTGCLAPILVFMPILLFLTCRPIASVAVWHSPLAVETTAMIDDYRDGTVYYHYFAGSTRYDKVERSSRFEPAWDSVEPTNPVVYLTFDPSSSNLDFNIVKLSAISGLGVFVVIFLGTLLSYFIYIFVRAFRREMRYRRWQITLFNEATHLLEGRVTMKTPGRFGFDDYIYAATSPTTGAEIRGSFWIDRNEPRTGDFHQGTVVAILYHDDKLYWML